MLLLQRQLLVLIINRLQVILLLVFLLWGLVLQLLHPEINILIQVVLMLLLLQQLKHLTVEQQQEIQQ